MNKFVSNPYVILFFYLISLAGFIIAIVKENLVLLVIFLILTMLSLFILIYRYLEKRFSLRDFEKSLNEEYNGKAQGLIDFYSYITKEMIQNTMILRESLKDEDLFFSKVISNLCTSLQNHLQQIFEIKVNVCFKEICVDSVISNNCENWATKTVARAPAENNNRRVALDNKKQYIKDNTSFYTIIKDHAVVWAVRNLDTYKTNLENIGVQYKNPNPNYQKFYHSTIVVPIQRCVENIPHTIKTKLHIKNKNSIHYLGFLCVDSLEVFEDDNKDFETILRILNSLNEIVYDFCLEKLLNEIRTHTAAA